MVEKILSLNRIPKKILFRVPKNSVSVYTGNKGENIPYIQGRFGFDEVFLVVKSSAGKLSWLLNINA